MYNTLRILPLLGLLLIPGCMRSPEADVATAQAITEIADELSAMRAEYADIQAELDSLRTAVAKQDTLLRRFANLAGMPLQ
jgi:hypothetical protein